MCAHARVGVYLRVYSRSNSRLFLYVLLFSITFYRRDNNRITTKLTVASINICFILLISVLCNRISNKLPFQRFKGWHLSEGYALFDTSLSRMGTY